MWVDREWAFWAVKDPTGLRCCCLEGLAMQWQQCACPAGLAPWSLLPTSLEQHGVMDGPRCSHHLLSSQLALPSPWTLSHLYCCHTWQALKLIWLSLGGWRNLTPLCTTSARARPAPPGERGCRTHGVSISLAPWYCLTHFFCWLQMQRRGQCDRQFVGATDCWHPALCFCHVKSSASCSEPMWWCFLLAQMEMK